MRDEGRGSARGLSPGYGLISMQQRAGMLGGVLVAGPTGQGFLVSARLPVEEPDPKPGPYPGRAPRPDPDLQLVEPGVP